MAFVQRQISLSFSMEQGNFQGGGNTANFSAMSGPAYDPNTPRISAHIEGAGGPDGITLSAAIYGMPLSMMNALSLVGKQFGGVSQNTVSLSAGDTESGQQLAFKGWFIPGGAFVDGSSQPNVCFRIEAKGTAYVNAKPIPPTSVKGQADAVKIMQGLAGQAGLQFENNGVSAKMRNPYFWSTLGMQMRSVADHGGFEHVIDRGTLAIWPSNGNRSSAGNVFLSPQTGMVGYPAFEQASVVITSIFNAKLTLGGQFTVQSSVTPANGTWNIIRFSHDIEANIPKGKWFTTVVGGPSGQQDTPGDQ
jgi:hypothetical protein